jgi:probable F420-dependent oxidoreductase
VRPFRFGVIAISPAPTMTDWIDRARRVEALGYSTLHLTDHFDRSPVSPLPMLAALASHTSSLTLGTLVLDNDFRHPAVLAKELATLDLITGGRLEVGLGAGWMTDDYDVSGIAFDPPRVRIARLDETLQILDDVLRGGPTTFDGQHYRVSSLRSVPPPTSRPRPRLMVGGGGDRVLSLAARRGDVVSVNWSIGAGRVGEAAVRSGARPETLHKMEVIRTAAGDRFEKLELHLIAYLTAITTGTAAENHAALRRLLDERSLAMTPEDVADSPHCLVGTVEGIIDRLVDLRAELGFSYVTVYDTMMEEFAAVVEALAGR